MSSIINEEIQKYIDEICGLIRNKRVHSSVKEEITNHIEELTQDYMDVGISEEEAVRKAIEQMGAAEAVGKELNKIHKAAPDWILIGLTGGLIAIGLFVLWYIQSRNLVSDLFNLNYFKNSMIYLCISICVAGLLMKFDYRKIKKHSKCIYCVGIVVLCSSFVIPNPMYGYAGWVTLGLGITINTFLVAPYILILALSGILSEINWHDKKQTFKGLALAVLPMPIFILGHSIAYLIIYCIGIITIMLLSGVKLKNLIYCLGGIGILGGMFIFSQPYRVQRFMSQLNPRSGDYGYNELYNQISMMTREAGIFGKGSEIAKNLIPEFHTDYVFTFIIYCFGWIAGIALLLIIGCFIYRLISMGRKVRDDYGKLLVYGFCALISCQLIIAILVNLNITALVTISMPFISYSGTSLLINILSIGAISNVLKWRNTPYKTVG